MHIYQEQAGIISPEPVWICFCKEYMYCADTLELLLEVINAEWEDDKHLVG